MKKDKKNIVILILSIIILILLFLCVYMYFKIEYMDDVLDYKEDSCITNTNVNENSKYISKDDALELVLKSLNINKDSIYDLNIELEKKFNTSVYELDFKYDRYEYEFYVNAESGEILKSFKERD